MANKITSGQLKDRIEILSVADVAFGDYSLKRTVTATATRWAKVIPYSVAQKANRGMAENITHRFIILKGTAVDNKNMIRWDSNRYKVVSVQTLGSEANDVYEQFVGIDAEYEGANAAYDDSSPEVAAP